MKLKKCSEHGYTLRTKCKICGAQTISAHYKFVKIKDVSEIKKN